MDTVRINGVLTHAGYPCDYCDWRGRWPALHTVQVHWPCECGHRKDEHVSECLGGMEGDNAACRCTAYREAEGWTPE